jgi:Fic/DOC family N-terminal
MLISILSVREAKNSSDIENIVTSADQMLRYAQGGVHPTKAATHEAPHYRVVPLTG